MSYNACEDIQKAMDDAKPLFHVPAGDHYVRIVSKESMILEQILRNQLLIMSQYRKNCDVRSQNSFQKAINKTQKLLNEETS